jgi:hypothetical protein
MSNSLHAELDTNLHNGMYLLVGSDIDYSWFGLSQGLDESQPLEGKLARDWTVN